MVVALVAVLLLLDPTVFGKLNRKRNGASGQNVRLSTHQDRLDVGGAGVERENSLHKIETLYSTRLQDKRYSFECRLMGILTREQLAVLFLRIGLFARSFQGLNRRLQPKPHPRLFVPSVLARFPV
jgi:hypothetical protein